MQGDLKAQKITATNQEEWFSWCGLVTEK